MSEDALERIMRRNNEMAMLESGSWNDLIRIMNRLPQYLRARMVHALAEYYGITGDQP